ncbi:MAG: hypothetical protein ACLTKE_12255 [Coprococcus sp.]
MERFVFMQDQTGSKIAEAVSLDGGRDLDGSGACIWNDILWMGFSAIGDYAMAV